MHVKKSIQNSCHDFLHSHTRSLWSFNIQVYSTILYPVPLLSAPPLLYLYCHFRSASSVEMQVPVSGDGRGWIRGKGEVSAKCVFHANYTNRIRCFTWDLIASTLFFLISTRFEFCFTGPLYITTTSHLDTMRGPSESHIITNYHWRPPVSNPPSPSDMLSLTRLAQQQFPCVHLRFGLVDPRWSIHFSLVLHTLRAIVGLSVRAVLLGYERVLS